MDNSFLIIGTNFKVAELDRVAKVHWREQTRLTYFLKTVKGLFGLDEIFFLETCNRREFFMKFRSPDVDLPTVKERWLQLMERDLETQLDPFDFFLYQGDDAFMHLFKVASSLESMVLGETEITKQIKDQTARARQNGLLGPFLSLWVDTALRASKRVRTETAITKNAVTLASLAYRHVTHGESRKKVVFIGAGHFMRSILPYFTKCAELEMIFVNRTLPADLALQYGGVAMTLDAFLDNPPEFDALISATRSQEPIIKVEWLRKLPFKPTVFIDLALPADICHQVAGLPGVSLFNLQGLECELKFNRNNREAELPKAEPIFREMLSELKEKLFEQSLAGFHREIRQHYEETGDKALEYYLKEHGENLQALQVEQLRLWTRSLVGRLVSVPVLGLKGVARHLGHEGIRAYTDGVRTSTKLFQESTISNV